ncbi:hypothetical protein BCR24_12925 [Enterococcus ureilyticus]|uniref:Lipoprotein n=1 Tax=Enterococcus ureilyticus TaxID=1131292 RepID=A0A1E5HE40_9ENTE|nr:hypothetical protein [Enterococcus ureilyticus]MBM7689772.1 TolA-binding protein [Enterococcus ureilyticus]OEG23211.1 hypothetical protein BCR24_12925 [Enterococcus ureilyticus]
MKKIIVAVTILSMLTLVGCGNSTGDKKTSESTKTEEQFEKEAKKREEDAKRKQELVEEISIMKESIATMQKFQKESEQMATENTFEDIQANFDESVAVGKQGIEDLQKQLADAEAELKELK